MRRLPAAASQSLPGSSAAAGGTLRVWTIQDAACWRQFEARGVLRADGRRVERRFRPAYRWLMEQMRERIPGCGGGFPVWFWVSPKPDLRSRAHLAGGRRGVRLEVELPRERALLLDFETWHFVLNRWHLALTWREERRWSRRTSGLDVHGGPLEDALEADLQASWRHVFDLEALRRSPLFGCTESIQGVTEFIRIAEVRRVEPFVAR